MPAPIFIDVDNTDPKHKLFKGTKAGDAAEAAEAKMQAVTKRIVDKASDFTTQKPTSAKELKELKGYFIMMEVATVQSDKTGAKCTVTGYVTQYPRIADDKGGLGDVLVVPRMSGSASVQGMRNPVVECVEAVVEDLVTKALPMLRKHFATSR